MLFLRNHDELTLEMVTDEERDYMYRAYARDPQARINLGIRRRLAPLMGNNRRKIELLNGLLLSLPGTPVIYYGDEIGMGDNIYLGDRNGVRTPMQWNANRNAGFSNVGPQQLYLPVIIDYEYHYETVNVETQQKNPNSLLWWMQRLIALRQQSRASAAARSSCCSRTIRRCWPSCGGSTMGRREQVLVVANLSRFPQYVELDLASLAGSTLVEMFGQGEFPQIKEIALSADDRGPRLLLVRHPAAGGAAIAMRRSRRARKRRQETQIPLLEVQGEWDDVFEGTSRRQLEKLLPGFLASRRWFGGKARTIRAATISDVIPIRPTQISYAVVQVQLQRRRAGAVFDAAGIRQ